MCMELQFLHILIYTERTIYGILYTFDNFLQAERRMLSSMTCTAHFSNDFKTVLNKKIEKLACVCVP